MRKDSERSCCSELMAAPIMMVFDAALILSFGQYPYEAISDAHTSMECASTSVEDQSEVRHITKMQFIV